MPISNLSRGPRVTYDASIGSALTRGPRRSRLLNSAGWANNWPAPESTLDIDFVNNRGFVKGLGTTSATAPFTFTRASTGTFVGPDGLLKGAGSYQGALGQNLLTFPQDFDNAAWNKGSGTTVTPDSVEAYDGTATGDILNITATWGGINRSQTAGTYTLSIFVKPILSTSFRLQFSTSNAGATNAGRYADFTLIDAGMASDVGALGGGSGTVSGGTASIDPPVNGWYRCVLRNVTLSATNNILFTTATNTATFGIWGAQLETNAVETPYFPTNYGQWRFDWGNQNYTRKNLLVYTEQVENAAWAKTAVTVDSNVTLTTDPLGGNTADHVISTNTTTAMAFNTTAVTYVGQTSTFSIYLKKPAGSIVTWIRIFTDTTTGAQSAWFNITTGQWGTVRSQLTAHQPEDVGNGWYRIAITYTSAIDDGTERVFLQFAPGDGSLSNFTGDGTSGVFVWGAQYEVGSVPTEYQAVGASTVFAQPLLPTSTVNGALIEPARTNFIFWCRDATQPGQNMLTYSDQFDNESWTKTALNTSGTPAWIDVTNSPEGLLEADFIIPDTTSSVHTISRTSITFANIRTYTISVFAKAAGYNFLSISVDSSVANAAFDLSGSGSTSSSFSSGAAEASSKITSFQNGWFRCELTFRKATTEVKDIVIAVNNSYTLSPATFTGSGSSGIYLWGAQYEMTNVASGYQRTTNTAFGGGWNKFNCNAVKNQTGIDGVANSCTLLTATAENATCIQSAGISVTARNSSVFLKRVSGSGKIKFSIDGGLTWTDIKVTNTWTRFCSTTGVPNPSVGILIETSGDSVAIDYAQNEAVAQNLDPSSPILTTTSTVARSADLATISGSPWINRNAGTFRNQLSSMGLYVGGGIKELFYVNDGSGSVTNSNFAPRPSIRNIEIVYNISGTGVVLSPLNSHKDIRDKTELTYAISYGQEFFELSIEGTTGGPISAGNSSTYGPRYYINRAIPYLNSLQLGGTVSALTARHRTLTYVPRAYQTNQLIEMTRLT